MLSTPRVIFKCPHIKGGSSTKAAAHLSNYVSYISTREGVERVDPGQSVKPATKKQLKMVEQLLRDFPSSRGLFEYEDFRAAPTRGNASEFITRTIEDNYEAIAKRENYVDYIANRPRVQKLGAHGLFTADDSPLVLSQVADEVAHHPGVVWLPIVNANLKMSIFAETECHFSAVSVEVYTALIHNLTCRLEPRQALIYQLVLGLTGENGKYNYSRAVHLYPPFFDITCSAKNYKIAPALTNSA